MRRRVALAVVRLTGALPAIRFARQFADFGGRLRRAQKSGKLVRQGPDGGGADQSVAGRAPGQGLDGWEKDGRGHGGGEDQMGALHDVRDSPAAH